MLKRGEKIGVNVIESNLCFNGPLTDRKRTDFIVLHHSDAGECSIHDIHRWHLAKSWLGCGYNYFVRKDGLIYRGRPREAAGAQCDGYNNCSIGICAEGNFQEENMLPAQENAIIELCKELSGIYTGAQIVGHRELNATACPGANYPLEKIKAGAVAEAKIKESDTMFKDVPAGHLAAKDIEWLKEKGIVKGDDHGNFRPDEPATRAEVAVLIARALRLMGQQ